MKALPVRGLLALILFVGAVNYISALSARELHLIGPNIPPQFDKDGNGRIGNVIKAALASCGHKASFTIVPFGRHWKDYVDNEDFDGLATAEADQTFPGFSTKPFIHLQDGATILLGGGLSDVMSIEDLHGNRVVAFPSADKILGIQASVPKFKSFKMRANRFDQLRPLFSRRADVVLADGLITAHFISLLRQNAEAGKEPDVDVTSPVQFRNIFAAGPQRLYFRDENITRDFDRCFNELLESGEVERITKPYIDVHRDILGDQYPIY